MSQVKNLRAMFEQKGESSPPDRGRVQGLPAPTAESPRPLSRVRTSFITVEKDGRVGLQRDPSSDSVQSLQSLTRKTSEGETATPPVSQPNTSSPEDKSDGTAKLGGTAATSAPLTPKRTPAPAPIPEETTPVTPTKTTAAASKPASAATPKAPPVAQVQISAPTPTKKTEEQDRTMENKAASAKIAGEEKKATLAPKKSATRLSGAAQSQPGPAEPKKVLDVHTNGSASTSTPNGATNGSARAVSPSGSGIPIRAKAGTSASTAKDLPKASTGPSVAKNAPKAISTSTANAKPATKSPSLPVKTPTSPSKPLTPKYATKTPDRKTASAAENATNAITPKSTSSPGRSTASSSIRKLPAIQTFPPNGIGFVKPKPKSPTRPVQLPSGLTTHTASSATKVNVPRQSLSRQSGNFFLSQQPPVRSPSRASVSTVGTTTTTGTKGLRRQSSTISRPRPSIGPPPKQPARDHPVTKKEKEVDEGFLARMMRPTQASASKTADKVHLTPPRKQAATTIKKPTVRNAFGPPPKQQSSGIPVKKIVPKAASSATPAVASASAPKTNGTAVSSAKDIAPIVEKSATAEDVVAVAKAAEGSISVNSKPESTEKVQPEPIQATADVTADEITAEEPEKQNSDSSETNQEQKSEVPAVIPNGVNGVKKDVPEIVTEEAAMKAEESGKEAADAGTTIPQEAETF